MTFTQSYTPHYFSIDDILATQERVPCKFVVDVLKMGILNPSTDETDLTSGTNLELPFWLVTKLTQGKKTLVATADLPRVYREAYREILKADASAVDLYKFNIYYYEFGSYARQYDNTNEVKEVLIQAFRQRFKQLMDLANNSVTDSAVQSRLDILERNLYSLGQIARAKLNAWLIESNAPLAAANMVSNHKKRKRVVLDLDNMI